MNLLNAFYNEIAKYLSRSTCQCSKLIQFHETGESDFSFPLSLEIWSNLVKLDNTTVGKYQNIIDYSTGDPSMQDLQGLERLKAASSDWTFKIETAVLSKNRCFLTINRAESFTRLLTGMTNGYGKRAKVEDETLSIESANHSESSITRLRVEMISAAVLNLIAYSKFTIVRDSAIAKHKILMTSHSNINGVLPGTIKKLVCGAVLDQATGKISQMDAQEYISKRCADMHLISVHKYGVRVKDDAAFKDLVEKLGRYAATLDLMEVKPQASVTLTSDPRMAFILYNSARMETLMEKFDKKVEEGYYEPLPDVRSIDTSLLKEDEEWDLLKLLLAFPDSIDRAISDLPQGKVSLHLIHKFLSALVNTFSIYYRRVRLLTENRSQLMPVLHAKIHFLRAVRRIFNETLAIFSIEPVAFM